MEKNNQKSSEQKRSPLKNYIRYSGIGFQMIATMVLAAWAGMKLDDHFGIKSHLITIFLLLFAVISSIYFVIRTLMNDSKNE